MVLNNAAAKILCFGAIFFYFAVWAVVRPPYQSPDEFAHHVKSGSLMLNPWLPPEGNTLTANEQFVNPLVYEHILHSLPHTQTQRVSRADIKRMKGADWSNDTSWTPVPVNARANWYPVLYYWGVFVLGQGATEIFDLSPYDSFYAYRLGSALIAALLWCLALFSLKSIPELSPYRFLISLFILLNVSLAFISGSINPDALLNPLATLLIIQLYKLYTTGRGIVISAFLILACIFTKGTGVFLLPAAGALACLFGLKRRSFKPILHGFIACGIPALFAYLIFYRYVMPVRETLDPVVTLTFSEYLNELPGRIGWVFHSFCGVLGWLEYGIRPEQSAVISYFLFLNLGCTLFYSRTWAKAHFTWAALSFGFIFAATMFFLEYSNASRVGLVLQGRYFLPIILSLAMLLVHRVKALNYLFLLYLVYLNLQLFHTTVHRYYSGRYERLLSALPFI